MKLVFAAGTALLVLLFVNAAHAAVDCVANPQASACLGSGTPGPQGPAGPQGDVGPAGPQGATGATGPAGADGAAGTNGTNGIDGATGPKGDKGDTGATGATGAKGDTGATGATGAQGVAGADGKDGKDGTNGVDGAKGDKGDKGDTGAAGLNGRDFDLDKSLALSSALSMPVWLGDKENVRVSGGLGFSGGGETAIGATGVVRLDKNWSGFVGGAISTDGRGWAGKAGASVGW